MWTHICLTPKLLQQSTILQCFPQSFRSDRNLCLRAALDSSKHQWANYWQFGWVSTAEPHLVSSSGQSGRTAHHLVVRWSYPEVMHIPEAATHLMLFSLFKKMRLGHFDEQSISFIPKEVQYRKMWINSDPISLGIHSFSLDKWPGDHW